MLINVQLPRRATTATKVLDRAGDACPVVAGLATAALGAGGAGRTAATPALADLITPARKAEAAFVMVETDVV